MGVPKFFRYISERYPCLSELVREEKIPEFDNLYLDMNGIIHTCSHPDDSNIHFRITEENIFKDIFNYIDKLFFLIKPKKLFFMAVDGVAPRAKMNQQRSRRFRSAKDAELLEKNAEKRGEKLPDVARFDSNCITPGTSFMERLQNALKYFVKLKISTKPLWQKCRVILSGHETPGEGEHKIMEYIRFLKSKSDYDENTRHCLYGLDADLIILGLCTHQLHFSLLREEVSFSKKAKKAPVEETRFFLLHLNLLREYLELEFILIKDGNQELFDIHKIIDDWILMGFLVGNDFIPHLPSLHINTNALPILYNAYIKVWPTLRGYINENGKLNLERFEKFMEVVGEIDEQMFSETYADLKYLESKKSSANDFTQEVHAEENQSSKMDDLAGFLDQNKSLFESDSDSNFSNEDYSFQKEFMNHKRNYYIKKLNYKDMTSEVLAEQTHCYITALQWILFYYYQGVPSWGWFYPHHYAPFASDIKKFKDFIISFEIGKPFLPFQQLLAVLPAASKEHLPVAFRHLMVDPKSKLIQYYPTDFETDLNGKKQEWEAVVLIPFIDEEQLLNAMLPCLENLTPEEVKRNSHGAMLQYDYNETSQGECPGIYSLGPLYHVFCKETKVWRDEISSCQKSTNNSSVKIGLNNLYYLGFPTMKHLEYIGEVKKCRIKVFDQPTRNESMVLLPRNNCSFDKIEELANDYLNKVVYIGWPHLTQAKVIAVSSETTKIDNTGVNDNDSRIFNLQVKGIQEHHLCRMGIDFQEISIIVHVKTMIATKYVHKAQGKMTLTQMWNDIPLVYPLQGVVSDINVFSPNLEEYKKIEEEFPIDTTIFMLSSPYFGSQGKVIDPYLVYTCGRLKVGITVLPQPDFSKARLLQREIEAKYINIYEIASTLGISSSCLHRITSAIFVIPGIKRKLLSENTHKMNIGLQFKFPRNNQELSGYSRKVGNAWLFSQKAIEAITAYYEKYSRIFEIISRNCAIDTHFESDLFPLETETKPLNELMSWLRSQEHFKAERVPCGTKAVEKEVIPPIIAAIEDLKKLPVKSVKLQVKPHLVLKPESNILEAFKPKNVRLFDRIVVVKNTYQVPFGFIGTVVGIHPVTDPNPVRLECVKTVETFYEILFDKELAEGHTIHGLADGRISKISETAILTIYHQDERLERLKQPITFNAQRIQSNSTKISNLKDGNEYIIKSKMDQKIENILNTKFEKTKQDCVQEKDNIQYNTRNREYFTDNITQNKCFYPENQTNQLKMNFVPSVLERTKGHSKVPYFSDNVRIKSSLMSEEARKLSNVDNTTSFNASSNILEKNTQRKMNTYNNNYENALNWRNRINISGQNENNLNNFMQQSHIFNNNFNKHMNLKPSINRNGELEKKNSETHDHTDTLRKMLGLNINSQAFYPSGYNFEHKQDKPNATHLPPPPSKWRNEACQSNYHNEPLLNFNTIDTSHPRNTMFYQNSYPYQSKTPTHHDQQVYSQNISSGIGAFIPIQTMDKDQSSEKVEKKQFNTGQDNITKPINEVKKKVIKQRVPKIAARFDFKDPPQ